MEKLPNRENDNNKLRLEAVTVTAEYSSLGKQEYTAFIMSVGERKHLLHWENTIIRVFDDDHSQFNHVEVEISDDEKIAISDTEGELVDILIDYNYKYHYDPMPDEATISWYVDTQAKLGHHQLGQFLDGQ